MLFLKQFRILFISFIKNSFAPEAPSAPEQNNQNEDLSFEDSLKQALEDNTLDWEDLAQLEALKEHYSEDKWEVFAETKEGLQSVITEMLQDGYTVNNQNDYEALRNIMSIVDGSYKIPDYQDMMSKLPEDNREKFSFVLNDNKDRLLVYVMEWYINGATVNTDEYWYIQLSNWEFDDSTWNSDFLTSFDDDIDNNNQVSIDDTVSRKWEQHGRGRRLNKTSLWETLDQESEELAKSELIDLITSEWYIKPSIEWFDTERPPIPENIEDMTLEELNQVKSNIDNYNIMRQSYLDSAEKRELISDLSDLEVNSDIPDWFEYDWEVPVKPEDLSGMTNEDLEWLISKIQDYNSTLENFRQEQEAIAERQRQEQEEQERQIEEQEATQALNKARMFYERVWSNNDSITELQQLLLNANESLPEYWADGGFWKETFVAIKSFQQKNWLTVDWMAWNSTLEALWVEKSVTEFYTWKKEASQEEIREPETEDNQESVEEDSFIDWVGESISEWYNKVKEWIAEIFRTNEDIKEFTWVNWKTINLEFDESGPSIHVDTPFFDWVSDFPLTDLPSNLDSLESAKDYVLWNIEDIKEEYNNQYLDNAINMVSSWLGTNYNVWSFETEDGELLNVRLMQETDHEDNFEWVYVNVATAFFWDGIRDHETRVDLLDSNWWEITREQLQSAIEESISKYKELEQRQKEEENENNN